jgi:hypothetical protein
MCDDCQKEATENAPTSEPWYSFLHWSYLIWIFLAVIAIILIVVFCLVNQKYKRILG